MKRYIFLLFFLCFSKALIAQTHTLPDGFVYVRDYIPNLVVELRYYSSYNFVGDTIHGYRNDRLILSQAAAIRLKEVQMSLNKRGLALKVYDAYRPQEAVNHFVKWARVLQDTLMKSTFYPEVEKRHLFKEGYIASKSGHSRGSTVDLTIIYLDSGKELDMGSTFDYFGKESWVDNKSITKEQQANRQILQEVMNQNGFRSYSKEWWHFTLRNEPFPDTYFSFPIE